MYMVLITHGRPRPRKTLTEFDPVTLPMAESAYSDDWAAVTLAKVSGREVPMATKVMAVIDGSNPTTHPRRPATDPTIAVIKPMRVNATKNAGTPPPILTGGTTANNNFQPIKAKWKRASLRPTCTTTKSSSSIYGPSITAFLNCYVHDGFLLLR